MTSDIPAVPPVALTIAGSDSGGGAGIQADLKTFTLLGCFGATAITAITAQNTRGVQAVAMLSPEIVTQQIASVAGDLHVAATKTGMLGTADVVEAVAGAIERFHLSPLVVDPVMIAKSGDALVDDEAVEAIVRRLLPLATIVTPNRHEAARLVGFEVATVAEASRAAEVVCARLGARACVVKGIRGDGSGRDVAVDVFFAREGETAGRPAPLAHAWHEGEPRNTHGSGCTFSAALTAHLARGASVRAALDAAKRFIDAAIASPFRLGAGVSPVDHFAGETAVTRDQNRIGG